MVYWFQVDLTFIRMGSLAGRYLTIDQGLNTLREHGLAATIGAAWWPGGILPDHFRPPKRFDDSEGLPLYLGEELAGAIWKGFDH